MQQPLRTSRVGKAFIKGFEAKRLKKYFCQAGKPTIGYGHVITPDDGDLREITDAQADALFDRDLAPREARVNALLAGAIGAPLRKPALMR